MKDMIITKDEIVAAAAEIIRSTYNPAFSPDERRGMKYALQVLSDNTQMGSQLSELFKICAKSIPVSRNASKYYNPLHDLIYEIKIRGIVE